LAEPLARSLCLAQVAWLAPWPVLHLDAVVDRKYSLFHRMSLIRWLLPSDSVLSDLVPQEAQDRFDYLTLANVNDPPEFTHLQFCWKSVTFHEVEGEEHPGA